METEKFNKGLDALHRATTFVSSAMHTADMPDDAVRDLRFALSALKDAHMNMCMHLFYVHAVDFTDWDLQKLRNIKDEERVSDNKELYDGDSRSIIRFNEEKSDEEKE